jgi:hypothetical protein
MATYSALANSLRTNEAILVFRRNWLHFFPDVAIPAADLHSLLDLSADFMHLVNERLFPIDFQILDDIYNTDGDALECVQVPIPFRSWGVEFMETGYDDVEDWAKPLVALLTTAYGAERFWDAVGFTLPEDARWYTEPEAMVGHLATLEPPLDGLAVAYKCVWQESGNPFFDCVSVFWRGLYWDDDSSWYNLDDIQRLADDYQQAKPAIARLEAYIDWYEQTPDAGWVAARIFKGLEEEIPRPAPDPDASLLINILAELEDEGD